MTVSSPLPTAEFGFPGPLRDKLVAAILSGAKTTTTSLLMEYAIDEEPLPAVGTRQLVIDSHDSPVAVIETLAVEQARLGSVSWAHAQAEGEGHANLGEWRADHEAYWHGPDMRDFLGDPAFTVTDQTLVVLERFRLVASPPGVVEGEGSFGRSPAPAGQGPGTLAP
ncbi:ASCH domain-containing protein [Arthrobacter sp. TMN-37]